MTCCNAATGQEAIISDEQTIREKIQEETIRHASHSLENGQLQTSFIIPDMHCAACISTIERGLAKLSQVANVRGR